MHPEDPQDLDSVNSTFTLFEVLNGKISKLVYLRQRNDIHEPRQATTRKSGGARKEQSSAKRSSIDTRKKGGRDMISTPLLLKIYDAYLEYLTERIP